MNTHSDAMFRCHLPAEDGPSLASECAPNDLKILIVNEDMRSADSLKLVLNDLGYFTTLTAYSARRALEIVVDFTPSVALLDLELPDMTGYQLAHRFRAHLSKNVRHVPMLAIAELAKFGDIERTRAAGFMGCLAKPVPPMALNSLLSRLQSGGWT